MRHSASSEGLDEEDREMSESSNTFSSEAADSDNYEHMQDDAKGKYAESDAYEEDSDAYDPSPDNAENEDDRDYGGLDDAKMALQASVTSAVQSRPTQTHVSSSSDSSKARKEGNKSKKIFSLPLDRASFETFIDDNTILDDDGYPLFPNGNTVFVKQPGHPKIANWGSFGFAYTSSGGKSKGPVDWRTVRYSCLGVLVCENLVCDYLGSPPTAGQKRIEWMSKPQKCPAARCPEYLCYLTCSGTLCRLDEHENRLSLAKFGKKVVENPDVGPLRHKVGRAPAGEQEIVTATDIHPAFGNLHQTGYYQRKLLVAAGVIPEKSLPGAADDFIDDMDHWSDRGLIVEHSSMKRVDMHMTIQTEWMQQQLLARNKDGRVYGGGLLSDVTYKFFKTGYLLSTSMYHEDLRRWVPIQLTWLMGLTDNHYAAHFRTLMKQIKRSEDISEEECDILVRQVVDFSTAQKNGFIKAYMEIFEKNDRAVALSKLAGCHEHFRAQITRVKRNRAIIPGKDELCKNSECKVIKWDLFEEQASSLLKADRPDSTFDQKIAKLMKDFPKAKRWLEWWKASDVKSMLFKSRPKQIDDDSLDDNIMPSTTNAQESLHRVYYMILESNCTIQIGFVQLYALVASLERDHADRLRGVSLAYGDESRNYKKVARILGWTRKSRKRRKTKNNGRPPDTTDALLGRPKKAGRPKGSLNVDRNPVTTSTWEIGQAGKIRGILLAGQNTLHAAIQQRCPGSFPLDTYASAEGYFKGIFDLETRPQEPSSPAITQLLFRLEHIRTYNCPKNTEHILVKSSRVNTISISHEKFDGDTSYSQLPQVLREWTTSGLYQASSRYCQSCKTKTNPEPHPFKMFHHRLVLDPPPPHLHIQLDVVYLYETNRPEAFKLMRECDLPYELKLKGTTYWMRARGFWNGNHYWCQVIRTVGSLTGVWGHNDMDNAGIATLLSTDLEVIGGPMANTSWLLGEQDAEDDIRSNHSLANQQVEKNTTETADEITSLAKKKLISSVKKTKPGKPVNNATDTEGETAPLAKKKTLSNIKKTKSELNPRKRKMCAEQEEDKLPQEHKPLKRGRKAKGGKRKMCAEQEEDEPAEGKVVKDKLKRGGKTKGWKGWAIVEVDEEEELGKDAVLQEEAQEEVDEGDVNVQSSQDGLLHLLVGMPSDVNPFLVIANALEASLKPGIMPPWAQWLNRCILIGFFLMWIQASRLLYIRIQTNSIHSFRFNQLGLLRIDVLSLYVVGLWVYSMPDMILHEAIMSGLRNHSGEIILFVRSRSLQACSFISGLLWVCVVQATLLVLESSGDKKQLPRIVRWTMNAMFLTLCLAPIPAVIATYAQAEIAYSSILRIGNPVILLLREAAVSYSPEKDSLYQISQILVFARPATYQLNLFVRAIRRGMLIYVSVLGFVTVFYIPLLIVSLRVLFQHHIPNDSHACSSRMPFSKVLRSPTKHVQAIVKMRKMVVYHSVFTLSSIFTHSPVLIWRLFNTKTDFLRNQTWILVTRLGLHGPFVIAANLILLAQNLDIGLWLEKDESTSSMEISDVSQFSSAQQGSHPRFSTAGSSNHPKQHMSA
ncbi:hypothetical protein DFH28DRAFT_1225509 [Melampsora americana]|nr:hypothetical protein DFH28DRAFT_1225509 [Melampsora americana]